MSDSTIWLGIAYCVGTIAGYWFGKKSDLSKMAEILIDTLIADGYIKTKGEGKDLKLLKHWED
jgi:hypothetical protein